MINQAEPTSEDIAESKVPLNQPKDMTSVLMTQSVDMRQLLQTNTRLSVGCKGKKEEINNINTNKYPSNRSYRPKNRNKLTNKRKHPMMLDEDN